MSDEPTPRGSGAQSTRGPARDSAREAAPVSVRDPRVGTIVAGKYRILERIGAGGMARVYKAEQQPLGRVVALKVVNVSAAMVADDSEGDVLEKRFFREASILARLQHPNVVTLYDFGRIEPSADAPEAATPGEDEREYYMAMELVLGESLEARLRVRGALPWRETVRIARQIAAGLLEAHALGVVHRDLKPANVMLTPSRGSRAGAAAPEELVKLLDFGIGKVLDGGGDAEPALTMDGLFVGSPGYVAPEQVMTGIVDARSDIYSLGVLMYRCLAGQSPFPEQKTAMGLMTAHVHDTPRSLRAVATGLPTWLVGLVHRCLEKAPERRPQSVEELLAELGAAPSSSPRGREEEPTDPDVAPLGPVDEFESPPRVGLTEPPTIADRSGVAITGRHSQRPAARRDRKPVVLAAIALLSTLAVAMFVLHGREAAKAPPRPSASPASAASFTLIVDSTPRGARVREAGRVLGETPLTLTLDVASFQGGARTYDLELAGHRPWSFQQGAARETVRVLATLSPATPSSEPATAVASSAPPVTSSAPSSAPSTAAIAIAAPRTTPIATQAPPRASASAAKTSDIQLSR